MLSRALTGSVAIMFAEYLRGISTLQELSLIYWFAIILGLALVSLIVFVASSRGHAMLKLFLTSLWIAFSVAIIILGWMTINESQLTGAPGGTLGVGLLFLVIGITSAIPACFVLTRPLKNAAEIYLPPPSRGYSSFRASAGL